MDVPEKIVALLAQLHRQGGPQPVDMLIGRTNPAQWGAVL